MENKDISLLEELLYNTNKEDTISRIKNIDNQYSFIVLQQIIIGIVDLIYQMQFLKPKIVT